LNFKGLTSPREQLGPDSSDALSNSSAPVRVFQSVLLDPQGHPEHAITDVFTAATYDLFDNTTTRDWFRSFKIEF
jgi:hypothetical protein